MRRGRLLAAVLTAVIIGICIVYLLTQSSSVRTTPISTATTQNVSGVLPTYPVTITDSAGRSITLERPARRIVAQGYAAWMLAALNATDTIVGTTDSAIRDPLLRHRLPRNVTSVGEFFGPGAKVSIEKILALQPGLVIAPTSYPAEELEAKLPPHIKVVRLDFWGVSRLFDEVEKLALLVNKAAEARRLIAKYKAVLEEINKAVAGAERPAVYYEWYSDYNTVGRLNEWHNAVEAAGGRNVFGDLEQDSVRVSPEAVVARDPDVIIRREHARYFNPCLDNSTRRLEEVAKAIAERPGWAGVRAVREGRVYVISAAYQNGFGVIAHVAAIAKALHPDRLRDVDPDRLMLEWLRDAGVLQYCRGVRQWVHPPPRPSLEYPVVITDSDGRKITLERPASRIVAHTYAVWVLAALNATDRVVGTSMTSFRGDPAFMKLLPKDVADIGSFFGPGARVNVELIASLNPDVVIAPTTFFYPESELEAKLPPHVKVVRLDFMDVKKLAQETRTLGVIVNKTAEAEKLVKKVERLLKLVRERVAEATSRPKVYLEWYTPYSTPGRGSYWHELIELAGGVNAFSDLEVKGLQSFVQVSPESVVQRAPDVIVRYVPSWVYNPCAARNATALARLRAEIAGRPGWSSIPAVANNRTYAVSSIYDGGYGKAVHLALLAKLIHPELFADIDIAELFNDLLRTMGVDRYCTGARVWVYPPAPRGRALYPAVIVDALNRTVVLEKPARRIVAHNYYAVMVLAALNATDLLVGVSAQMGGGTTIDPLLQRVVGRDVPTVGPWNAPSLEKIVELNPDVVIAFAAGIAPELDRLPPSVKVVRLRLMADPESVIREVKIIGLIINKTEAAGKLASKYEKLLEEIKRRTASLPPERRVRVYFEFWYPQLLALGGRDPYGFNKAIEIAGGINIFKNVSQATFTTSAEAVIASDPDVIIGRASAITSGYNPCLSNSVEPLARFYRKIVESRPGWSEIRAVREGRMYVVSNEYLQALGMVAMTGYIAKALHPELFSDFNPDLVTMEWLRDMGIDKYCAGARVWVYPPLK